MFLPEEISVGTFADAQGLSLLMLPDMPGRSFLITCASESKTAICLEKGEMAFAAFDAANNRAYTGLLVPKVRIELDETSIFSEYGRADTGSLLRKKDQLIISTKRTDGFSFGPYYIILLKDLPPCQNDVSVGFSKWSIVVGEGKEKRILYSFGA